MILLIAGGMLAVIIGILIVSGTLNQASGASNDTVAAINSAKAGLDVTVVPAWISQLNQPTPTVVCDASAPSLGTLTPGSSSVSIPWSYGSGSNVYTNNTYLLSGNCPGSPLFGPDDAGALTSKTYSGLSSSSPYCAKVCNAKGGCPDACATMDFSTSAPSCDASAPILGSPILTTSSANVTWSYGASPKVYSQYSYLSLGSCPGTAYSGPDGVPSDLFKYYSGLSAGTQYCAKVCNNQSGCAGNCASAAVSTLPSCDASAPVFGSPILTSSSINVTWSYGASPKVYSQYSELNSGNCPGAYLTGSSSVPVDLFKYYSGLTRGSPYCAEVCNNQTGCAGKCTSNSFTPTATPAAFCPAVDSYCSNAGSTYSSSTSYTTWASCRSWCDSLMDGVNNPVCTFYGAGSCYVMKAPAGGMSACTWSSSYKGAVWSGFNCPRSSASLVVTSSVSGASVYLNGSLVGTASPSFTFDTLVPGYWLVNVSKAGYVSNWSYLTVPENWVGSLSLSLPVAPIVCPAVDSYCSNAGTAYSSSTSYSTWASCRGWCDSLMDAVDHPVCTYFGAGSCYVMKAPAGGLSSCTWSSSYKGAVWSGFNCPRS